MSKAIGSVGPPASMKRGMTGGASARTDTGPADASHGHASSAALRGERAARAAGAGCRPAGHRRAPRRSGAGARLTRLLACIAQRRGLRSGEKVATFDDVAALPVTRRATSAAAPSAVAQHVSAAAAARLRR